MVESPAEEPPPEQPSPEESPPEASACAAERAPARARRAAPDGARYLAVDNRAERRSRWSRRRVYSAASAPAPRRRAGARTRRARNAYRAISARGGGAAVAPTPPAPRPLCRPEREESPESPAAGVAADGDGVSAEPGGARRTTWEHHHRFSRGPRRGHVRRSSAPRTRRRVSRPHVRPVRRAWRRPPRAVGRAGGARELRHLGASRRRDQPNTRADVAASYLHHPQQAAEQWQGYLASLDLIGGDPRLLAPDFSVTLEYVIRSDGHVHDVRIWRSSGVLAYDARAVDVLRHRAAPRASRRCALRRRPHLCSLATAPRQSRVRHLQRLGATRRGG